MHYCKNVKIIQVCIVLLLPCLDTSCWEIMFEFLCFPSPFEAKLHCFDYRFSTFSPQHHLFQGELRHVIQKLSILWVWCVGGGITLCSYFSYSSDFLSLTKTSFYLDNLIPFVFILLPQLCWSRQTLLQE